MAAVLLLDHHMAQNNINNNDTDDDDDIKPNILHDFFGRECTPVTNFAAASHRGGGPVSATSDLGSERQVGTVFEGVPFFPQKSDFSGSMIRYSGSKRTNPDSGFMAASREAIPQLRPDFPDTSHLTKMLRNVGDEPFMGVHQTRPTTSSSHMVQPANAYKWERAIPCAGQVVPYKYQPVSNRFKHANLGSPVISQSVADEGSRTGIKGSGVFSSVNVGGSVAELMTSKPNTLISNTESGSSTSASCQMTIFYGGQAHVFDDVHPNKADVIMALAGSNGGSWSTSFSPNLGLKPSGDEPIPLTGGQGDILMKDLREQKSEEKQR